jgi:hypothetical protein
MTEFVYLLLQNEKTRDVINTITATAVLILGRFTSERKAILEAVREELRHRNYVPAYLTSTSPGARTSPGP